MNERLDRIVKSYLPRLVQSVCESVRIPSLYTEDASGFPYGIEIARAADHAMACARQLDFKVTDLDGKICWADYGDGEETVAVMGHLDVVAVLKTGLFSDAARRTIKGRSLALSTR